MGQGFTELVIGFADAERAGRLPDPHRDPFDRVFAAQSLAHELPVVAVDPVFDGFGVIRVGGQEASFGSRRPGRFRVHGKGLSACVSVNR